LRSDFHYHPFEYFPLQKNLSQETQQGIGGGVYLLPNFRYNKAAFNKEDIGLIWAGLNSLATIDDTSTIKTLLAKLRLDDNNKMLLENDIIIDFTTWNHNNKMRPLPLENWRAGCERWCWDG